MKKCISVLVIVFLLISCSNDDSSSNDEESSVEIRLSNVSAFNFENVMVITTGGDANFTTVNSGQATEYILFEKAYRYAFVELEIEGETFTVQPIDYVGESLLKRGKYTYELDANDSQERYGRLTLTLIEE